MKTRCIISLIILLIFAIGCEQESGKTNTTKSKIGTVYLEDDNNILATVNGSKISQYDLNASIQSTFTKESARHFDDVGRKKILDSLIASKAISQAQEKVLTDKETCEIEKKVNAYREQLLVKQYVMENFPPAPVTQKMVKTYYENHPERFGSKIVKVYEMISSTRKLKTKERDALMHILSDGKNQNNWKKWSKEIKDEGYPVSFRKGQVLENLLHPELYQVMETLDKGNTSELSFIKGQAYLVRITDEKMTPPKSFDEVKDRIRKSLIPIQLKRSATAATEKVLKTATVVYKNK